MISLPFIPYDFGNQTGWEGLVQVVRSIVELSPAPTLATLVKDVRVSLDATRWMWEGGLEASTLVGLLSPKGRLH
jgi:E3 ubiquitin-protein ligase HUWE1